VRDECVNPGRVRKGEVIATREGIRQLNLTSSRFAEACFPTMIQQRDLSHSDW
jgi:hypothetical protein